MKAHFSACGSPCLSPQRAAYSLILGDRLDFAFPYCLPGYVVAMQKKSLFPVLRTVLHFEFVCRLSFDHRPWHDSYKPTTVLTTAADHIMESGVWHGMRGMMMMMTMVCSRSDLVGLLFFLPHTLVWFRMKVVGIRYATTNNNITTLENDKRALRNYVCNSCVTEFLCGEWADEQHIKLCPIHVS